MTYSQYIAELLKQSSKPEYAHSGNWSRPAIHVSGGLSLSLRGRQPEAISIPNDGDCFASLAMTL
jgi:hypothetical protein